MNAMHWKGIIIVTGIVCGTILAATATPGAWFPWTVVMLILLFG